MAKTQGGPPASRVETCISPPHAALNGAKLAPCESDPDQWTKDLPSLLLVPNQRLAHEWDHGSSKSSLLIDSAGPASSRKVDDRSLNENLKLSSQKRRLISLHAAFSISVS